MTKPAAPAFRATDKQLHIAGLFYPILLELAQDKTVLSYKALIEKAQAQHPNDLIMKNMIPVRSGPVLGILYHFAEMNGLPRISTLIVNHSGECGDGIASTHDCVAEREKCFAFDWSVAQPKFWSFIAQAKASNASKRIRHVRITIDKALNMAWAYYLSNRDRLIKEARNALDSIAKALCSGTTTEDAFKPYLKA
jgi:hypothetical protein